MIDSLPPNVGMMGQVKVAKSSDYAKTYQYQYSCGDGYRYVSQIRFLFLFSQGRVTNVKIINDFDELSDRDHSLQAFCDNKLVEQRLFRDYKRNFFKTTLVGLYSGMSKKRMIKRRK